ncbi:MAG: FecR domain-containing protein [Prevotellaceae bacterium]|jgi:ferric-dicitrate binding protein FerR (iron transport regulator)|nr:FecR domain-containing protein [Prevotellaceae bacterium]
MKNKLPWDLIISKLRGKLSEEGRVAFNGWLAQGNNQQLFEEFEAAWESIRQKAAGYEPDIECYWKELSARINKGDASLQETTPFSKSHTKYIPIKRFYRNVAAASIILLAALSGLLYISTQDRNESTTLSQSYSSINGKSTVVLPDGSEIWLHSNTTLSYRSNPASGVREVDMNGEAYFKVKHDARRPFVVNAGGVSIKVCGTAFNVNSCDSQEKVLVSLYEGSVLMRTEDRNIYLKPGEEGGFDKRTKEISVSEGDVEFAKSWTQDYLRFEDKNLRYVCRYLSKWYAVDIEVHPSITDEQSYTFTLRNESLEEIARMLARVSVVDYRFDEDNRLILKPKNKK